MGIPGSANPMLFGGAAAYQINQSLRFNSADSAYLNRTPASAGNRKTFTYSFWIKRAKLGAYQRVLGLYTGASFDGSLRVCNDTDSIGFESYVGSLQASLVTSAKYRDPSAWMHVVYSVDTTQATASDRVKIYVNGQQVTSFSTATYPSQNADLAFNNNSAHYIGQSGYPSEYLDAYLAEFYSIDGTALTPSSFGETDTITGAWIPKKYSGSYGTNGFYLKFESSGIGTDSSGNGNTWTANNFSTSGTGTDVMSDTPTNNWCTLNPLTTGSYITLSNGNLDALGNTNANNGNTRSTFVVTGGKFYFEMTLTANNVTTYPSIGIMREVDGNRPNNGYPIAGYSQNMTYGSQSIVYQADGTTYSNSVSSSYGSSFTNGDVIGVAYDGDNGAIYFSKNGTWQNSGDPTSGASKTGAALTWTDNRDYVFSSAQYNGTASSFNFGQRSFSYTPPTGFKALNTANLPEPTIKKGDKYFDTKLYTGTGGSQSLSGLGFQPDLVWIKARSTASSHGLYDAVRGVGQVLLSNSTSAEQNYGSYGVTSFNSAGFSVNDLPGYGVNDSGQTYAAWCWDANGAGASNTAGTITSTVSANATAGFSIATYTGNGTAGATVGHGLGVAPKMIMVKRRDTGADWAVYHASTGATKYLTLNNTNSAGTSSAYWNNTEPTSTVFSLGLSSEANTNAATFVAYCFSEVAGYSKFGSYTGNGSSDGPFVFCGFKPRWILTKSSTLSGIDSNWRITDTARNTYNVSDDLLWANLSDAGGIYNGFDICSNGFKIRTASNEVNSSGQTYIFVAFSETAFKYSNAR